MLTQFQMNALTRIVMYGGAIYYNDDKSWCTKNGYRIMVPSEDGKTEGFIGLPTIQALLNEGMLGTADNIKYVVRQ